MYAAQLSATWVDMARKVKASKLITVVILTVLIWIWSDLALENDDTQRSIPIKIDTSIHPTLWAAFHVDGEYRPQVFIESIELKGPEASIKDFQGKRQSMDLSILPEDHGFTTSGTHQFPLLAYLNTRISRDYGLAVLDCLPQVLNVQVATLVEIEVPVSCIDSDLESVSGASIDPPVVKMFIPEDWEEEQQQAHVLLTDEEVRRAREEPLEKRPYIEIYGQRHNAGLTVRITTPRIQEELESRTVDKIKLGYIMSPTIRGKYDVQMDNSNLNEAIKPFNVETTAAALSAYKQQLFHVLLVISDSDALEEGGVVRRELQYNFPADFFGKIRLEGNPVSVDFTLVPKVSNGNGG
jgi:hypothetical protein